VNHAVALGAELMILAQDGQQNRGPDFGKASPFGLIVVVLLLIAVFFLVWSMNRHLRKLPESFDDPGSSGVAGEDRVDGAPDADPDVTPENPADGTKREPG
jgi:hypothetical protein